MFAGTSPCPPSQCSDTGASRALTDRKGACRNLCGCFHLCHQDLKLCSAWLWLLVFLNLQGSVMGADLF